MPSKEAQIHILWWFCHTKLLLGCFGSQPQASRTSGVAMELQYCMYFVLALTLWAAAHYFSSHAKSAVMNVHTCCCFLCLPRRCWNMNDSKAVQDIFHKTAFSPQNHSIKCHLPRRGTYGKVNAMLLCSFVRFIWKLLSRSPVKQMSGEETDFIWQNWH